MFSEGRVTLQINYNMKKAVETEVIKSLQKAEYTLNTVNSYGDNLLHITAANGCLDITREILQKQDCCKIIDRKNEFGWSPLMLAIRNRDVRTVKYLLEKESNVNESTYLGMSVLGLAAAVNKDMFEIVYKKCPSALLNTINDDITPLCVAALRNDKNLFFRLIELGFDVSKSNEYTYIMMKQSTVPEIRNITKHVDIEDYWNDTSDNILIESELDKDKELDFFESNNNNEESYFTKKLHNIENEHDDKKEDNVIFSQSNVLVKPIFTFGSVESDTDDCNNNVITNVDKNTKLHTLSIMTNQLELAAHSLISPTLTCTINDMLPASPNMYFLQDKLACKERDNKDIQLTRVEDEIVTIRSENNENLTELPLQRLQCIRPPDLDIQSDEEDLNATLGYVPEFSPLRSPNVPSDINDENVFGEDTPTPPRYKTPPRGMILNSEEAKMFVLLERYGLSQHLPTFLAQEVDIDLFTTLTNEDLIEIGIRDEADRKVILNVILDYKDLMM